MPECAANVKKEFLKRAALLLDHQPDELDIEDARIFVRDDPSVGMDARDVMYEDDCVPIYGYAVRQNDRTNTGIPYGAWMAEVEVDIETGKVEVTDIVIATDAGTVLHASGAESQQLGGQCMGIGESIYEEIAYDRITKATVPIRKRNSCCFPTAWILNAHRRCTIILRTRPRYRSASGHSAQTIHASRL